MQHKEQIEMALNLAEELSRTLRTANSAASEENPLACIMLVDLIELAATIKTKLSHLNKLV